jgi:hypothetical protein
MLPFGNKVSAGRSGRRHVWFAYAHYAIFLIVYINPSHKELAYTVSSTKLSLYQSLRPFTSFNKHLLTISSISALKEITVWGRKKIGKPR